MIWPALLAAGIAVALAGPAAAACTVATPPNVPASSGTRLDTMTSDQVKLTGGCIDGIPIGQNTPAAGNFSGITLNGTAVEAQVATNAALAAAATASHPNGVWRRDYSAGLGAPPLFFTPQTGTCAANSMTSDGGSCVDTTAGDGNSWKARHPAGGADVRQWGAAGDVEWATCTAVATGTALSCPGAGFVAADVGKRIEVPGAGTVTNTAGVTAIPVTDAGTGYTSVPTCSVSGTGGSGATCSANMKLLSATINAAGSGCTGSTGTLTLSGGTGKGAQVSVTFTAGAVSAINSVLYAGSYTAMPTLTGAAALGSSCTGVTLNLTMGVDSITVGAGGSNYPTDGSTTASLSAAGGTPATLGTVTVADTVGVLASTIASVVDADNITTADAAGANPNASKLVTWGTDSSAGFQAALDAESAVSIPVGIYWANDLVMNSGNSVIGSAAMGYYDEYYSSTENRPVLVAKNGATSILDPEDKDNISIHGVHLDGNNTGANCITANDTGRRINITNVTAIRCSNGLGSAGKYTHVATIINSVFAANSVGILNLIDSKLFGGSVTSNTTHGVHLQSGANANTFAAYRAEWNGGYGIVCDGCALNNFVGVEFDRNGKAGLGLTGACRSINVTGGWFRRNGKDNTMAAGSAARSHVFLGGTCSRIVLEPGTLEAARNDDGTGSFTPAYFLEINSTISNLSVNRRSPLVIGGAVNSAEVLVGDTTGTGASTTTQISASYPLTGTTSSIGGSSVAAGACTSGTASVSGATTGMAVSAQPVTYPGDGFSWSPYVSASGTVTVKVCNYTAGALTPTASAYNVRVIQ